MTVEVPARLAYPEESYLRISDFMSKPKSSPTPDGSICGPDIPENEFVAPGISDADSNSELSYNSLHPPGIRSDGSEPPIAGLSAQSGAAHHNGYGYSQSSISYVDASTPRKRANVYRQLAATFQEMADLEEYSGDAQLLHEDAEHSNLHELEPSGSKMLPGCQALSPCEIDLDKSGKYGDLVEFAESDQKPPIEVKQPISLLRYAQRIISPEL